MSQGRRLGKDKFFSFLILFVIVLIASSANAGPKETLLEEVSRLEKEKDWKLIYYSYEELHSYSIADKSERVLARVRDSSREDNYIDPIFSPEGDQIVVRYAASESPSDEFAFWSVHLLDSEGKFVEELFRFHDISGLSWSPDGKDIAFSGTNKEQPEPPQEEVRARQGSDQLNYEFRFRSQNDGLFIFRLDFRKLEQLVEKGVYRIPSSQAWSPDSKKILYETTDEKLMIFDFETRTSTLLAEKGEDATWSSKGDWIAYRQKGPTTIESSRYYLIRPNGTVKKLLIDNSKKIGSWFRQILPVADPLYWSPDGRFLLYNRLVGVPWEHDILYLMRVEDQVEIQAGEVEGRFGDASWVGKP